MTFMHLDRVAMGFLVAFLPALFAVAQEKPPAKSVKAVRFGKLWDAKGRTWTNAIVIVEGDRVRGVTSEASTIPAGAEVVDLSKYTGLPGLIDVHTHMTMYTEAVPGKPMVHQIENPAPGYVVFLARKGAMRVLEAGVTTVRDLGADQYMDIAMRDLAAHVRRWLCLVRNAIAVQKGRCVSRRRVCRWRPGGFACGPPTSRRGSGFDQDVRFDGD
jgi:hypothetical protein